MNVCIFCESFDLKKRFLTKRSYFIAYSFRYFQTDELSILQNDIKMSEIEKIEVYFDNRRISLSILLDYPPLCYQSELLNIDCMCIAALHTCTHRNSL